MAGTLISAKFPFPQMVFWGVSETAIGKDFNDGVFHCTADSHQVVRL
jgi:hypothetical protein